MPTFVDPINLGGLELRNARAQNLAAAPGSPGAGLYYFDTVIGAVMVWDGAAWYSTKPGGATGAAGGDLTGTYPNPTVAAGAIDNSKIAAGAAIALSKLATDPLARANHTGTQLAATISDFDTQVRTSRLDQMAAPTADVSFNGHKATGLTDGAATTDAATVGQLNAAIQGREWKDPVLVASTANLALTGNQTIDTVVVPAGSRVLAKNQTAPAENGIYITAAGAWTRATDADTAAELTNATVLIQEGAVGAGDTYTQTAAVVTLGTDTVTWTKTGEGNTVYGADGTTLQLVGTTFSIVNAGVTEVQLAASVAGGGLTGGAGTALAVNPGAGLEVVADAVRIAAAAAGNGLTGGAGAALAVGAGTGISVTADAVAIDTAVVAQKYTALIGDGAATSLVVTHNLGNRWVTVQVFDAATNAQVYADVTLTSTTQVTITFATAPAANAYRVVVTG